MSILTEKQERDLESVAKKAYENKTGKSMKNFGDYTCSAWVKSNGDTSATIQSNLPYGGHTNQVFCF